MICCSSIAVSMYAHLLFAYHTCPGRSRQVKNFRPYRSPRLFSDSIDADSVRHCQFRWKRHAADVRPATGHERQSAPSKPPMNADLQRPASSFARGRNHDGLTRSHSPIGSLAGMFLAADTGARVSIAYSSSESTRSCYHHQAARVSLMLSCCRFSHGIAVSLKSLRRPAGIGSRHAGRIAAHQAAAAGAGDATEIRNDHSSIINSDAFRPPRPVGEVECPLFLPRRRGSERSRRQK